MLVLQGGGRFFLKFLLKYTYCANGSLDVADSNVQSFNKTNGFFFLGGGGGGVLNCLNPSTKPFAVKSHQSFFKTPFHFPVFLVLC